MSDASPLIGRNQLRQRLRHYANKRGLDEGLASTVLADLIVLEILSSGSDGIQLNQSVRGGVHLTLRTSLSQARLTKDLDLLGIAPHEEDLQGVQGKSLGAFTLGRVWTPKQAKPENIPGDYLITRVNAQLLVRGGLWRTVKLDFGIDELGLNEMSQEVALSPELQGLLKLAGIESAKGISCMGMEYQIAQKLHALTAPESDRGHDLYDIFIYMGLGGLDFALLESLRSRIFSFRNNHSWEGRILPTLRLKETYETAVLGIQTAPNFEEALDVVNRQLVRDD